MKICSGNGITHDEIVFECALCPTCELLEENQKLEDTVFKLEETIKEFEDKDDMDK